jgi:hypothetical protein
VLAGRATNCNPTLFFFAPRPESLACPHYRVLLLRGGRSSVGRDRRSLRSVVGIPVIVNHPAVRFSPFVLCRLRNIDGRPFDFEFLVEPLMRLQNRTGKTSARERSSTALRFASFLHSILRRSGGASRVEMNALRAPLTLLPTSQADPARFPFHGFSLIPKVKPPQKNRSASLVSRNFLAMTQERPLVVPFERFLISLRKERPR